jgi:hypothetical protein
MSQSVLGSGGITFTWSNSWSQGGHHNGDSRGWAHHGIAVAKDDRIFTFHEERPEVLVIDAEGNPLASWPVDLIEGHGMTIVVEDGVEALWISDNGSKNRPASDGSYVPEPSPVHGTVAKYTLTGEKILTLSTPPLPIYENGDYGPTQVAVDQVSDGGSGDIWVSDCYGQALVHRFDQHGAYLATIDGAAGAGRFAHPHAVYIDRRAERPELYVADRRNKRVQVFTLEGDFVRSFGEDFLLSPSGFAAYGDNLVISELDSRLVLVDGGNRFLESIGEGSAIGRTRAGWPNALNAEGAVVRPPLAEGAFSTPHGVAADSQGNLYVTEWLIGGRLVKLTRRR